MIRNRNRNLPALAAGLLLVLSSTAMAAGAPDTTSPTDKARANFHLGVQLYNEGSFEAALAEFRKAYQISPNYRLLYNIAQTYFDLHDYVSSFKTLKQYVREGGNEIAAERRAQVADLNQKLEDRIAYLDIDCNMEGADIRVDDLSIGVSPLPSVVLVNAGPRRISAVKPGYPVASTLITVVGRDKTKVVLDIVAPDKAQAGEGGRGLEGEGGEGAAAGMVRGRAAKSPPRIALITTAALAGGCAIATSVFGVLALNAKNDFDSQVNQIPNTKANIDNARTRMKNDAYLADAFGAATLVSGGVALYLLLTDSGAKKAAATKTSVAVAPTVNGMALYGQW